MSSRASAKRVPRPSTKKAKRAQQPKIGEQTKCALTVAEKTLPKKWAAWTPNAPALGLAFVIQAWTSFALFFGSVIGFFLRRHAKKWSEQYLTPICAGIIAGESLMGFFLALYDILFA